MAANSKSVGIASLGKRLVKQIRIGNSRDPTHISSASSLTSRRAIHVSLYEKNPDDQVHPSVVPDDLIQPESDKYWGPHPQTGVFGPTTDHNTPVAAGAGGEQGSFHSSPGNGGGDSVLEEQAWFRPTSLEDLEKPQ